MRRQRGGGRNDYRGGEQANDHGSQDVSGESGLDLELDDFYFEPTVLTGAAGEDMGMRGALEVA